MTTLTDAERVLAADVACELADHPERWLKGRGRRGARMCAAVRLHSAGTEEEAMAVRRAIAEQVGQSLIGINDDEGREAAVAALLAVSEEGA